MNHNKFTFLAHARNLQRNFRQIAIENRKNFKIFNCAVQKFRKKGIAGGLRKKA